MSEVKTNKISSLASNNDITLDPDGTGRVAVTGSATMTGTDTFNSNASGAGILLKDSGVTTRQLHIAAPGSVSEAVIGTPNSHNLTFATNNTESMRIDTSGRVTMPTQPAFSATASATNIPLTTSTTVTLSSERFDVGSHLASNTFTAPITGKYLFTYLFYLAQLDTDHTTFDVHIKTSNKQYQQTWNPSTFMSSDGNFSVSGSVIADMDANDTCFYMVYCAGGTNQTDIHADSQVSGCLLL